jgi:hypothetical protein
MSYVVLLLLSVGVTIYALVDCWRSADDEVRGLPRHAWILLIILVGPLGMPPFGSAAYLLFGRPTAFPTRGPVSAPDDDPDFLRSLESERRAAAEQESRDREQRDRQEHDRQERERKERERQERQQRKDHRRGDPNGTPNGTGTPGTGPESTEGEPR